MRSMNEGSGATLVVVPLTLLEQWEHEIKKCVEEGFLTYHVHYGQNRSRSPVKLAEFDIVLTTYDVIAAEFGYKKGATKA